MELINLLNKSYLAYLTAKTSHHVAFLSGQVRDQWHLAYVSVGILLRKLPMPTSIGDRGSGICSGAKFLCRLHLRKSPMSKTFRQSVIGDILPLLMRRLLSSKNPNTDEGRSSMIFLHSTYHVINTSICRRWWRSGLGYFGPLGQNLSSLILPDVEFLQRVGEKFWLSAF